MMRRLEQIRVLRLVTAGADLDLAARALYRVLRLVQLVAVGTCEVARCVRARGPIVRSIRLVTAEAIRVLLRNRGGRAVAEDHQAGRRATARPDMRAARSVAGLALQSTVPEGPAWIVRARVPGTEDTGDGGIVVAAQTGVGARWAVGGTCGI